MSEKQSYRELINSKIPKSIQSGFKLDESKINLILKDHQRFGVLRSLRLGRHAVFYDTGLGKSIMQLETAKHLYEKTGKPQIIITFLNISREFIKDAINLLDYGDLVGYFRNQESVDKPIVITNYEMIGNFDANLYASVSLDESSILKNYTGKIKQKTIKMFEDTPYRFSYSATPSPNEEPELGNHSHFLGLMSQAQMLTNWFITDRYTGKQRLIKHSEPYFWEWVGSWALVAEKPSDIDSSFSDEGYMLPPINLTKIIIPVEHDFSDGQLFRGKNLSATGVHKEARLNAKEKAIRIAPLVNINKPDTIWCNTDYEQDEIAKLLPNCIDIRGKDKFSNKLDKLDEFSKAEKPILTKPSITGFGLNWQFANNIFVFAGSSYSYEMLYQLIRRVARFGRKDEVNVTLVYADSESKVVDVVLEKATKHENMKKRMIELVKTGYQNRKGLRTEYTHEVVKGQSFELHKGDSVEVSRQLPANSVNFSFHSPSFIDLYIFSDSAFDMGNCLSDEQFYEQYQYCADEHYRLSVDGARVAIHCKDLPLYKSSSGVMGLKDFPQGIINTFKNSGFELEDWITVWKCPELERARTQSHGLLFKNYIAKSEYVRQGAADYMLIFKKGKVEKDKEYQPVPSSVLKRIKHIWLNEDEEITSTQHFEHNLFFHDSAHLRDTPNIKQLGKSVKLGRLAFLRVDLEQMTSNLTDEFRNHGLVFHTRCALTDGTWLIGFMKWSDEMPEPQVSKEIGRDYVGNNPPLGHGPSADQTRLYAINVWARYASPAWFDLDGLPESHSSIWMDINQTNVLNGKMAKEAKDERHLTPTQIDVVRKCTEIYTQKGDTVFSAFAGIGTDIYEPVRMERYGIAIEIKDSYFYQAVKFLEQAEAEALQPKLFS